VYPWLLSLTVQEIVTFPRAQLPPHIEDMLRAHQNSYA
jgi:hypothetical protein